MCVGLRSTLLALVLCWCATDFVSGMPSGVIRRGARISSGRREDVLSGKDFLSMFIDNQGAKDEMDQSAEGSSMVGEVRASNTNRVLDSGYRKSSVDFDDPVFGSRQSVRTKLRYPYLPHTKLSSVDKVRNDLYSDRSVNASQSQVLSSVENKPFYGSEFKNYFVGGVRDYPERRRVSSGVTQNIIALGESRSYSTSTNTQSTLPKEYTSSTNTQSTLSKEFDDNSISSVSSELSKEPARYSTTPAPEDQSSTGLESLTTIVHSGGGKVDSYSWSTRTRWATKQEDPEKIIAVKVSSSVGTSAKAASSKLQSHVQTTTEDYGTTLTLLTEEQPRVTAIQRSQLSVEESLPASFNPQISPVSYHTSVSSATSGSRVQFYSDPPSYHRRVNGQSEEVPIVEPVAAPKQNEGKSESPLEAKSNLEEYKHETRAESLSYHQEVVPSQPQSEETFGMRLRDSLNDQKTSPQTEVPTTQVPPQDQRSYQFTNVHDRSFHHVQVTHHSPDSKVREETRPERVYGMPEQNYEVDEAVSVMSNGRAHGVQSQLTTESSKDKDSNKFGYVVEGRNFRKYRVEERTSDGFIVGEYGVVRHDDGSLRGVRYTADSTINPRVIYDALLKFLSL